MRVPLPGCGAVVLNAWLIETYWAVGEQLSLRVSGADWGKGFVKELAAWLGREASELKGFSALNLWRMKQFYETYSATSKLATLLRELSWSKHLLLLPNANLLRRRSSTCSAIRGRWSHPVPTQETRYAKCAGSWSHGVRCGLRWWVAGTPTIEGRSEGCLASFGQASVSAECASRMDPVAPGWASGGAVCRRPGRLWCRRWRSDR